MTSPPGPVIASPLIERAKELDALSRAVDELTAGNGGALMIEAAAGLGKTALVKQAASLALDADCRVRFAAPGPLERHFPYGVIRALLEAPLREAGPEARAAMLDGAAGRAGELLLEGTVPSSDATMMVAHSVLWLCAALAEECPLALIVDDAHWADRSSLEVLAFLARRLADFPILLVVAARSGDPDAASDLLSMIGDATHATTLHPRPLSAGGSVRLVRKIAPDTPIDLCRRCHQAGHGNPWLITGLTGLIVTNGPSALDGGDDALPISARAREVVRRRLAALPASVRGVAEALSVVGDGADPHVRSVVTGVPLTELGRAHDALAAAGILDEEGASFAHALIGTAIAEDLACSEFERLQLAAARAQRDRGASDDVVASHLLQAAAHADPEVSELLTRAASDAWQRGAPHTAAAYLERAVAEGAPGDDHGRMLWQLATYAFDAGLPDARTRLREALGTVRDREGRVEVLTRLAALNTVDTADAGLRELLEREHATETDPDTKLALETAALDTLLMHPDRLAQRAELVAAAGTATATDPLQQRVVLAHRAWLGVELGDQSAEECAALAVESLEGGMLLAEARRRAAFHLAVRALVRTDCVDDAQRAIDSMRDDAIARGSLRLRAGAAWYQADLAQRNGRIAESENEARLVLDLVDEDVNMFTGGAVEILVRALVARGAFAEAHELLAERGVDGEIGALIWEAGILHARARLALAEGRFELAVAEARRVGDLRADHDRRNATWAVWRPTAAVALAHLGRRDEAIELAETELAIAERFGARAPIVTALHARAVAEPDANARLALCERALTVAGPSSTLLDAARVRVELGTTLRRLGRRVEARTALQQALGDADAAGAALVADHARRELVATGLRPRRAQTEGPAALTPRQRQVCDLAAAGVPNREIAQQLFLSVKTVETHLAASYRKLGVETREDLAAELAAGQG